MRVPGTEPERMNASLKQGRNPAAASFFAPGTSESAGGYAKKRIPEGKRAIRGFQNEANPSFGGSLPDLFLEAQNRYDSIREVATHKEPGKDKGRAQHRGTMARRETAAGR